MSEFVRKKIPQLKSRQSRVGKASVSRRSFPVGPDMFFRVYKDDLLELEIEFLTSSDDLVVVLHTNLGNYDGDWRDITFETSDSKVFTLKLDIDRCGLFRFKVRYSLDGGKNWYWDRVPFSEVMVDPAFTRDVRLYTFIPTISGHLGNWKKQLKRIAEMKFNVVHLLPVTTMGWSESPYAADDLFSIDESFLELASDKDNLKQFEDFVVAAKELGIRLCIDLVLNHVSVSSNMVNMCPEWIVADSDEPDGLKRAGCWHKNQWVKWEDLAKINYNHPSRTVRRDIWDYMKQYAMFWTNYANYTGGMIRFDNLHSSHEQFITELTRDLRREFTDIVILAEYFSDELAIERRVPEWGLNLLLANSWEYSFTPQLREYISYIHKISGKLRYFTPITSHDTGSPTQEFGSALATLPRYFINAFLRRAKRVLFKALSMACQKKSILLAENLEPTSITTQSTRHLLQKSIRSSNSTKPLPTAAISRLSIPIIMQYLPRIVLAIFVVNRIFFFLPILISSHRKALFLTLNSSSRQGNTRVCTTCSATNILKSTILVFLSHFLPAESESSSSPDICVELVFYISLPL